MCYRWCMRRRCGIIGRKPMPLKVSIEPLVEKFNPVPQVNKEPVYLDVVELEALKLIDLENLTFEEAGLRMNTSRNTVWRIVKSAREKIVRALIEGREIIIQK
ncbi:MAG: DUF134 domain-containing protein [Candidatus Verstraetearchaeota archaeon]|nr:DUF134 domain-containing protein [Candidatus Verstraetearchaeota archaeon]